MDFGICNVCIPIFSCTCTYKGDHDPNMTEHRKLCLDIKLGLEYLFFKKHEHGLVELEPDSSVGRLSARNARGTGSSLRCSKFVFFPFSQAPLPVQTRLRC